MRSRFRFSDWLCLDVEGDAETIRHFECEYRAAADAGLDEPGTAGDDQIVRIAFAPIGQTTSRPISGGHKSSRWRVWLSDPDTSPLSGRIELGGWPRGLTRMLVQGYFVEPLLSVAAVRARGLLLPAAAFLDGGAVVVIGSSGSGKTSLAIHSLATGATVLGDDQILIDQAGRCSVFPRRLRLYSDLNQRAPRAYERLPSPLVARLRIRRAIRTVSLGMVAPPLLVEPSVLGRTGSTGAAPIRRVVILERPESPGRMRTEAATLDEAVAVGRRLLREQRAHLAAAGATWAEAVASIEPTERVLLEQAFRGATIKRVVAPFPLSGDDMESLRATVLDPDAAGARASA